MKVVAILKVIIGTEGDHIIVKNSLAIVLLRILLHNKFAYSKANECIRNVLSILCVLTNSDLQAIEILSSI